MKMVLSHHENLAGTGFPMKQKNKELECRIIQALSLIHISVHGRAEDFARDKEHRAAYDICVSRAVANLSTLSEYLSLIHI